MSEVILTDSERKRPRQALKPPKLEAGDADYEDDEKERRALDVICESSIQQQRARLLQTVQSQLDGGYLQTVQSRQLDCGYLQTVQSRQLDGGYLQTVQSRQLDGGYLQTVQSRQLDGGYQGKLNQINVLYL